MKLLRQSCLILAICFIGEVLNKIFNLPIPGNVLGMIILLILLSTGVVKLEKIEEISNFLLEHLAFFFIPAGVGLISCFGLIKGNLIGIIFITLISTIIIMAVTGLTVQLLKKR